MGTTGSCDSGCSTTIKKLKLEGDGCTFDIAGLKVKKGKLPKKWKIKAECEPDTGTGTGPIVTVGPGTGGPGGPGTGGPGGPGTGGPGGPGGPGTGGPGGPGSINDCPSGFIMVCPQPQDGQCPMGSSEICPKAEVSVDSRMSNMMGRDKCECVPIVLMQLVMEGPGMRALDRAASTFTFDDVSTSGCTCSFEINIDTSKGRIMSTTGSCDAGCSTTIKKLELEGDGCTFVIAGLKVKK